jgi:formamidopyrimidine-DNA glycosylase
MLVVHLMIAGRFRLATRGAALPGKIGMAAFDFDRATLLLTEAGSHKRTQLHVLRGNAALAALDPGGIDVLTCSAQAFADALGRENHTLKRALTDPRLFSGIGNAYSDEILHRARLSPARLSRQLSTEESARLLDAAQHTLVEWTARLRGLAAGEFPEHVTAFREGMAVHGRHRRPCPACGQAVQRIVHAENETNYCAGCQTGGRLLADRALSRLMREDWPRTVEELEGRRRVHADGTRR